MSEGSLVHGSRLFVPYRAVGLVSNHVPVAVRYIQRRKENLVITVVGQCFHTYGCSRFDLLSVSSPHLGDISCLAVDSFHVYTSYNNTIYAWKRGTELKHVYKGHKSAVYLIMPFGPHLISVDECSILRVWDIKCEEVFLELTFCSEDFSISAILHPSTYLNKVLIASKQGTMQLWNLRTCKLVHSFTEWSSAISVLEQAPAIDVVAVGFTSGCINIHNIKYDETLIKFVQEWGPVTALSFRTDGQPFMASASNVGHIAIWDLENKRLHSQIRDAHKAAVTGLKFLPDEPLLVSSSPDNSLKMWIFDQMDGSGRLLHLKEGHSSPPCKIRFHGANGENILSAGLDCTLRSFSTVGDNLNKSLGQASFSRKLSKKKGIKHDPAKMPPITEFTSDTTREKEWDNIVACHRGLGLVTTWSYDRCCMGNHKLQHHRFNGEKNIVALCVTLSSCGNFVLIGYNTGHVDRFNIQSGIFKITYGDVKAHSSAVRGIAIDALNLITATVGSDKKMKFWRFKEGIFISSLDFVGAASQLMIHRGSAMLAVALDNFTVVVVDFETRKIVRNFFHETSIADMAFNPDARWLVTSTMDSEIRIWDLPSGRLIDCFMLSSLCTTLAFSPSGDFLATGHIDDLGINLWSNSALYSHVSLQPLPENYKAKVVDLPSSFFEKNASVQHEEEMEVTETCGDESHPEFKSPEQISSDLVTLSTLPHSRWQNLLNLDIIKKRNKPKEPPKIPQRAPFFLPIIAGLEPRFAVKNGDTSNSSKLKSKLLMNCLQTLSPFGELVQNGKNYADVLSRLKEMNPSSIDIEIRSLSPTCGGSATLMSQFMHVLLHGLSNNKDFELVQSYLALFLKVHWNIICEDPQLVDFIRKLVEIQKTSGEKLFLAFDRTVSILNYLKSVTV